MVEQGILVTCAAGNSVRPRTTINGAPWITTVGASTIDRSFVGTLKLGNGFSFEGTVFVSDALLYYGKGNVTKAMCQNLDTEEVSGKVVFCDNNNDRDILLQVNEVRRAGACAGIFVAEMADLDPVLYSFPSLVLKIGSGTKVKDYATGAMIATVKSMRFAIARLLLRRGGLSLEVGEACSCVDTSGDDGGEMTLSMSSSSCSSTSRKGKIKIIIISTFSKRLRSLTGKNFSRLVTYVGEDTAFYHAVSVVPPEMKITIEPSTLLFTRKYQRRSFVVHVVVEKDAPPVTYGFLKWTDQQNHTVSSPVVAISG
ncbi:hypothetical protein RJ639_037484 [Escallonia herrerae]|uniref:Subtilisin-like protease fibronectin type-III domain-containing protein n=1 Tax=Escallonia herrerae TaxID=1293975 RepID=A0AA89B8C3_9ASTE|nr:hypothetical protein RJ639_037484 [Escallonia herrerae]